MLDHDKLEQAALKAGVLPTAIEDVLLRGTQFDDSTPLIPQILKFKEAHPHWFGRGKEDALADAIEEREQKAYGEGHLGSQGADVRDRGIAVATERATAWQTAIGSTKKGVKPGSDSGTKKKASNPWAAGSWSITAQGALIKSLGLKSAQEIATAVGCKVGDLRPNRN